MKVRIITSEISDDLSVDELEDEINKFLEEKCLGKENCKMEWKQSNTDKFARLTAIITY